MALERLARHACIRVPLVIPASSISAYKACCKNLCHWNWKSGCFQKSVLPKGLRVVRELTVVSETKERVRLSQNGRGLFSQAGMSTPVPSVQKQILTKHMLTVGVKTTNFTDIHCSWHRMDTRFVCSQPQILAVSPHSWPVLLDTCRHIHILCPRNQTTHKHSLIIAMQSLHSHNHTRAADSADHPETTRREGESSDVDNEETLSVKGEDEKGSNKIPRVRLKMLAHILDCSEEEMESLSDKFSFFSHISDELVRDKVNMMISYGLTHSFIRKNPRLLYQSSLQVISERLNILHQHGFLEETSPVIQQDYLGHYLECENSYFPHAFKNLCVQRDALEGCADQCQYLQWRLQCSEADAQSLLSSYPLDRHASNVRVKGLLDFFLVEAGQEPQFVIKQRKLLAFSVARLRRRWEVMQDLGVTNKAKLVYMWCLTEKAFQQKFGGSGDPEE